MSMSNAHRGPGAVVPILLLLSATCLVFGIVYGGPLWAWALIGIGLSSAFSVGVGHVVRSWNVSIWISAIVLVSAMLVVGALESNDWGVVMLAGGLVGLIVLGVGAVIDASFRRERSERSASRATARFHPPSGTVDRAEFSRLTHAVEELRELALLSESTRRLLYGDRDHDVLLEAIASRIDEGEFAEAQRLVGLIEEHLGPEHAGPFRERIHVELDARREDQLHEMIASFHAHVERRDWTAARSTIDQVASVEPESEMVADLESRLAFGRDEHKSELEQALMDASRRDDIETAMTILKELDRYMTRDEAEHLSEEAQSIIQRHRDLLSERFRASLRDKRWVDAARTGNQIMNEFPNSKMANEVRSTIDVIRTRATQQAMAADWNG